MTDPGQKRILLPEEKTLGWLGFDLLLDLTDLLLDLTCLC